MTAVQFLGATSWIAPVLSNNWMNYGGDFNPAGYYKDSLGIVHLRGLIRAGTVGDQSTIFTLAQGYRPAFRELRSAMCHPMSLARVDITADGHVLPIEVSSNAWVSLDGISFRAV